VEICAACLHAMELITILNRCHRFQRFVYQHARFSPDKKSIEVAVRPRKGSAVICSRCHQPAPRYDQLAERRFEFIPIWGFFVFLLYTMRRVDCRRCGTVVVEEVPWGDGKRTLTKAYMLFPTARVNSFAICQCLAKMALESFSAATADSVTRAAYRSLSIRMRCPPSD
jgi:hypothetical protein